MPNRNWFNGLASGLIVGIFATTLTFIAIEQVPDDVGQSPSKGDYRQAEEPTDNRWWLFPRLIYAEDTFAQWLMAVFTILAVFLVWRTFNATRDMALDTRKMAIDTRQIGEAQVRAYLAAVDVGVRDFAVGKTPIYEVFLQNSGQSPARILRFAVGLRAADAPEDAVFRHMIAKKAPDITSGNVLPNQERFKMPLTDAWASAVQGKEKYIVVGGFVIYRDVFRKTRRLVFRYYIDTRGLKPGGVRMAMANKNNRSS